MPMFQYKAKKPNAETVEGQIIADSKEEAIERISQLGLTPVTLEDRGVSLGKRKIQGRRISHKEVYFFSRQLVFLLNSGISILRALEIVTVQARSPYFQSILENIRLGVKGGKSFSDCLAGYPNIFSFLYVALIRAGEESGKLHEAVAEIAEYLKLQNELTSKIKTAMAYPLLMLLFGVGTVIFILTNVMPQITNLFVNLDQALPWATVLVMNISNFLIHQWLWVIVGLLMGIMMIRQWAVSKNGRRTISKIKLNTPVLGDFWLKLELSRFCRTMALLMKSGVSIVNALKIAIPVISNEFVREELERCQDDLLSGRSFGVSLQRSKIIPDIMGHLIIVGEESGSLMTILYDVAENYDQETNELIKIMMTLLEPVMIVIIGSIVGFIVVAMLLPIFQLDIFAG